MARICANYLRVGLGSCFSVSSTVGEGLLRILLFGDSGEMLLYCLCMCCFFCLVFVLDLIFAMMSGMENDEVVCVIENGFFHLSWWSWVVMNTIKRMVWMGCIISEI